MTAPETLTVRWAGVERTVEVVARPFGAIGQIGDVELECAGPARSWLASVIPPEVGSDRGDRGELWGTGPTAQAALDDLAAKLRALAAWALATVGEGAAVGGSDKQ